MAGVDAQCYSGHSFQIRVETTTAAKGVPDSLIKTLTVKESNSMLKIKNSLHLSFYRTCSPSSASSVKPSAYLSALRPHTPSVIHADGPQNRKALYSMGI